MATFATILRKFEYTAAEPRLRSGARPRRQVIRALPNEDIFFHVKAIDNSRLVREADPRARGECWSTIAAVSALAAVLITSFAPNVGSIRTGYQLQSLKLEQQRLFEDRSGLEVDVARLTGAEHLGELAKGEGMDKPKLGQVAQLASPSEGTVAYNLKSKKDKGK
ncbi:MAG: hypothetical protein ABIZ80_26045 [Bryobacteraceae bacterium]